MDKLYNEELGEIVYSPESSLRNPKQLVLDIIHDFRSARELAFRLIIRDISALYRRSFLGVFWAFISPLATTITFSFLKNQRIIIVGDVGMPYPVFVMMGTIFWTLFSDSLKTVLTSVRNARGMLSRVNFPREALILASMGKVLFNFAIKFIILLIMIALYRVPLHWTSIFIPIPLVGLLFLGTALGVLVMPIAILIGDVSNIIDIVMTFWFYLTPIIYPLNITGLLRTLSSWNPITPFIITIREGFTIGKFTLLPEFFGVFCVGTLLLFLGVVVYRVSMPILIERMAA